MKYRFEIFYQNPLMQDVSKFMNNLDLIHGEICVSHEIELTTKEPQPILKLKNAINQVYQHFGIKIINIKGGEYE